MSVAIVGLRLGTCCVKQIAQSLQRSLAVRVIPAYIHVDVRHASSAKEIFVPSPKELVDIPDIPVAEFSSEAGSAISQYFYESWILKLNVLEMLGLSGTSMVEKLDLFAWYAPPAWYRLLLDYVHNHYELPWFASIICVTLFMRLLLIKASLYLQRIPQQKTIHDANLQDFKNLKKQAKDVVRSDTLYRKICQQEGEYIDAYNLRTSKRFLYLVMNSVAFISQYRALSRMADVSFPGWSTGGFGWMMDLTESDPTFIIPAISAAAIGITLYLGYDPAAGVAGKWMKIIKYTAVPAGFFLVTSRVSTAVSLCWCTSNLFNLLITSSLRLPTIRYLLDFPLKIPTTSASSFKTSYNRMFAYKKRAQKAARERPALIAAVVKRDMERFAKAGRPDM